MLFGTHQRALLSLPRLWSSLPAPDIAEEAKCLVVRIVSKAGGEHERVRGFPHRHLPFPLLLLPQQPLLGAHLKTIAPCLRDVFSADFMMAFDLEEEDAIAVIELLSTLGFADTVRIE